MRHKHTQAYKHIFTHTYTQTHTQMAPKEEAPKEEASKDDSTTHTRKHAYSYTHT